MSQPQLELVLGVAEATEVLGAALARGFAFEERGSGVLYLHGDLGTGKTTCARAVLRALGVDGPIRSPTYTLLQAYHPGAIPLVHVDLYRLQGPTEVDELGLRDYLGDDCLLLVEWPDRGGTALPPPDLELTLAYLDEGRSAQLVAPTARGRLWLDMLLHDTSLTSYVTN